MNKSHTEIEAEVRKTPIHKLQATVDSLTMALQPATPSMPAAAAGASRTSRALAHAAVCVAFAVAALVVRQFLAPGHPKCVVRAMMRSGQAHPTVEITLFQW